MRCFSVGLRFILLAAVVLFPFRIGQADDNCREIEADYQEVGELLISIAEDFETHSQNLEHHQRLSDGTVHRLFFNAEAPQQFRHGDNIEVTGQLVDDPTFGPGVVVCNIVHSGPQTVQIQSAMTGVRSALVLRVNFNDAAVACSADEIKETMWTAALNINGLYKAASFDQLSFPKDTDQDGQPDLVEVTINYSINDPNCDYYGWAGAAAQAALLLGVDPGLYQHFIFVLPADVPCNWAGLGHVGCPTNCFTWIKTCGYPDVYAHELGHNLGMLHASTDTDNDGDYDCEYCDMSGIMGYGGVGWRHFNAIHKSQMGWIPPENELAVSESGTYDIAAVEFDPATAFPAPPTTTQILKIAVPGAESHNYYISYRVLEDIYSANLLAAYRTRTSIHRRSGDSARSLYLTSVGDEETWDDSQGVQITQTYSDINWATVEVTIATPTPTPTSTPEPTASPAPEPTSTPQPEPSTSPTPEPTVSPTVSPTPSSEPTSSPTSEPSATPAPKSYKVALTVRRSKQRRKARGKLTDLILKISHIKTRQKAEIALRSLGKYALMLKKGTYRIKITGKLLKKKGVRAVRSNWKKITVPKPGSRKVTLRL
jgi:cell division septation protein DedD